MAWIENAIVYWSFDGGTNWNKVTDHNRQPLNVQTERIEKSDRMANGTLRKYVVAKKRSYDFTWNLVPSKRNVSGALSTADGGIAGEEIETFFNTQDGAFLMKVRKGSDTAKAANDGTIETVTVMFSDFSKEIEKRGLIDLWNITLRMEEV